MSPLPAGLSEPKTEVPRLLSLPIAPREPFMRTRTTGRLAAALLAFGAVSGLAQAQITHQVDLFSVSFSPSVLNINVGDTVQWNWVVGFHNVVSGPNGTPDGIFDSGDPVVITDPFLVTFDQAFLDANPVPNNRYDYYCLVHLPGMTGRIIVNQPSVPPQIEEYGSNINPSNSLRITNGSPYIGNNLTFSLDNPVDPLGGPGAGILFASANPDPNFPGGTLLPGFGMGDPFKEGELLINLTPPDPILISPVQTWFGSGIPVNFSLPVPNDLSLVGVDFYFQGALVDPTAFNGTDLTNALRVRIGQL